MAASPEIVGIQALPAARVAAALGAITVQLLPLSVAHSREGLAVTVAAPVQEVLGVVEEAAADL
jgi:hypothetical protein